MKQILSSMLAVLMVFSITACGRTASTTYQEQYDLGLRYLSEGNYQEAIVAFTAAIEIDAKSPEAFMGRGDAYTNAAAQESGDSAQDNYKNAESDYLAALDIDEGLAEAYGKLADVYLALDDSDAALAILEKGYKSTGDESLKDRLEQLDTEKSAQNAPAPQLTEEEWNLLQALYDAMSAQSWTGAAQIIKDNYEMDILFNSSLERDGVIFVYDGTKLVANGSDTGLVLRTGRVYYGELSAGLPDGQGTEVVGGEELDGTLRVVYTTGTWSVGKGNGSIESYLISANGTVSYVYGTAIDGVLEGQVTRGSSGAGEANEWVYQVVGGHIVESDSTTKTGDGIFDVAPTVGESHLTTFDGGPENVGDW